MSRHLEGGQATPLDNFFWNALSGTQAHFAVGEGEVRRFAPGFSPIVGFADPAHPRLDALLPYCEGGEQFYCEGWSGPAPAGWRPGAVRPPRTRPR